MAIRQFIPLGLLALATAGLAQDFPYLGPWEKYGGAPSGTEITPAALPQHFLGEWNNPLSACGTGRSDMRLIIRRDSISFWESDGEVKRVMRHNDRAVTVLATYSGEGQTWDRIDRLVLSRSGNEMTATSGMVSATRYRCAAEQD